MSLFAIVAAAVGVFLAAYATVLLFTGRKPGEEHREKVGCGFMLVAGLVWGYALGNYLNSLWAGMRLGLALALLLPALATLLHPARGRVLSAIVALTLAALLGGSVAPRLWERLNPSDAEATARKLEQRVQNVRSGIQETRGKLNRLREDRREVKQRIERLGHADFESLAADAAGYAMLKELAELDRLIPALEDWLAKAQDKLDRLEVAERRFERLAEVESATGTPIEQTELEEMLEEMEPPPRAAAPATVEEHVEREDLRRLYQREFGRSE